MTPIETKKAFCDLHDMVSSRFLYLLLPLRNINAETEEGVAAHLLFMCEEGVRLVEAGKTEKAMRWLGFVQGCVVTKGWTTISAMKDMNRGPV